MANIFEFCEDTDICAIRYYEWCKVFHNEVRDMMLAEPIFTGSGEVTPGELTGKFNRNLEKHALEKHDAIAFYKPPHTADTDNYYCLRFKDKKAKLQFLIKHG